MRINKCKTKLKPSIANLKWLAHRLSHEIAMIGAIEVAFGGSNTFGLVDPREIDVAIGSTLLPWLQVVHVPLESIRKLIFSLQFSRLVNCE